MDPFGRYLRGLVGSWEALAAPHSGAMVVRQEGFIAARFRHAVLNNAVLLQRAALPQLRQVYADGEAYAVWCGADDAECTEALQAAGFRRDDTTQPMICRLDQLAGVLEPAALPICRDVDSARIAELNNVPAALLQGVAGLRCYATDGGESGLAVQDVDGDAVLSFVATRPDARGQGLASLVTGVALIDARERGADVATLQATAAAERLYQRLGFVPVGRWQEWTLL